MMINRKKLGFIGLEHLMRSVADTLMKSDRTFSFHLGRLERHEDRIIIRCLGTNIEIIQYTLKKLCQTKKIPFEPMNKFYITLYKNVDFNKTHIEQQFTRRLGHQLILN